MSIPETNVLVEGLLRLLDVVRSSLELLFAPRELLPLFGLDLAF